MPHQFPYFPGQPLIDGGGQVYNILAYGGYNDGINDNSTALARATIAAYANGGSGGEIYFPPGTYLFSSPWILDNLYCLLIRGAGSNQISAAPLAPTTLVYTGTGSSSAISCRSSIGVKFSNLAIMWNSASFTGYLMDFGAFSLVSQNTQNCGLDNCLLRPNVSGVGPVVTAPAALLHLDWTYNFSCTRTILRGGNYNVLGRTDTSHFNNTILFQQCNFTVANTCAVKGIQQSWMFHSCLVEPLASGAAGFLTYDTGLEGAATTVSGCWLGDDNPAVTGAWINWGSGKGLKVIGNTIGCNAKTTAVLINESVAQGIDVSSNNFIGQGACKGLDFGVTTGHQGFTFLNNGGLATLGTQIAGTIPDGSIVQTTSGLSITSPSISGSLTVNTINTTGLATLNSLSLSGAPLLPNVFDAATADFETSIGKWTTNFHASLATTTAAALHGTHCLAATHIISNSDTNYAIASYASNLSGLIAVSPGQTWTALASFLCPPTSTPRTIQLDIYAVTNNALANFTRVASSGNLNRDSISSWFPLHVSALMPATLGVSGLPPAYAAAVITWGDVTSIPIGEVHYVDCCSFSLSPSLSWQDPAASNSNISVVLNTIQQLGTGGANDIILLAQNTGTLYANYGSGAGTGGVVAGKLTLPAGVPSISPGTGAGTGPTVSISGSDSAGTITILTGSAPATSATVATITISSAFPAVPRSVSITPAGPNSAALSGTSQVYEDSGSRATNAFVLKVGAGGLQASTTYLFNYQVLG